MNGPRPGSLYKKTPRPYKYVCTVQVQVGGFDKRCSSFTFPAIRIPLSFDTWLPKNIEGKPALNVWHFMSRARIDRYLEVVAKRPEARV